MSTNDSTSAERFMALYAGVKDLCEGDPLLLAQDIQADEKLRTLCQTLFWTAIGISKAEKLGSDLFTRPVDPTFINAWRDYERRFSRVAAHAALWDLGLPAERDPEPGKRARLAWDFADDGAKEGQGYVDALISFVEFELGQDWRDIPRDEIREGLRVWNDAVNIGDVDLRGTSRRRELAPFVLVPRHVSKSHGSSSRLFDALGEAQGAFVLGLPRAALALMRSTMEAVLRQHYGATAPNLQECIDQVSRKLPPEANVALVHKLRMKANDALHLSTENTGLDKHDDFERETEMVALLNVLRVLIEQAPAITSPKIHR